MPTDRSILEVHELSKSYRRRPILDRVELAAASGEAVAIIGSNGAGKSTLLGCLTGERVPDRGTVRICGHDPFVSPAAAAAQTGFVPEQPFLYGELTVAETIRFVSEVRGLDRSSSEEDAARLLSRLGLDGAEHALCRELSQGMGRKVAIVIALLHRPSLLVLDEAFNGLDRTSADNLLAELADHRARGGAVLLSSHDLGFLSTWCDRGLLLAPGAWRSLQESDWERWKEAPTLKLH